MSDGMHRERSLHYTISDAQIDREAMILLSKEVRRLKSAIRLTLKENAHLADGDNCTLKRLKEAIDEESERVKEGVLK